MNTQERLAFITEIAKRDSNIGKTGMMKMLYLLQAVCNVPLGYDFEIYTYGPYCQTVISDIEYAEFADYVAVKPVTYSNGMSGYQINVSSEGGDMLECKRDILSKYSSELDTIVSSFSKKSAKELELYSTIVFVSISYAKNSWEKSKKEICGSVKKIKPHFSNEEIWKAYDDLKSCHFIAT